LWRHPAEPESACELAVEILNAHHALQVDVDRGAVIVVVTKPEQFSVFPIWELPKMKATCRSFHALRADLMDLLAGLGHHAVLALLSGEGAELGTQDADPGEHLRGGGRN